MTAGKDDKKTVLLANHSTGRMPAVTNRLRRSGFTVRTTKNIIDTIATISQKKTDLLVIKPSCEPIPVFELFSLIDSAGDGNQSKTIFVLESAPDLKKLGFQGTAVHDYYVGKSPAELMTRIHLAFIRAEGEEKLLSRIDALEKQSITDYKTGIHNDRYILRRLAEEFQRSERHNLVISTVMIDLDGFKELNDEFGHPFGDFILQAFAANLKLLIRKIDIPGRYGGDEFLIILPNTGLDEAASIGNRIRSFFEGHTFEKSGNTAKLTISQGINTYSGDRRTNFEQFLKGADIAVFEAKKLGGNRVCLYPMIR